MAGLVEEARWRTSQKGRRFLMARFSDGGGQYDATVFDDEAAAAVEPRPRRASAVSSRSNSTGARARITAVTVKRFQPLDELARRSRVELTCAARRGGLAPF
jgi:DNA polymerase-3 subunit alpha